MALSQPDVVSRESLIERLRQELLRLAGDDQSICRLAAERGIFATDSVDSPTLTCDGVCTGSAVAP